jgi:hypothetical protein
VHCVAIRWSTSISKMSPYYVSFSVCHLVHVACPLVWGPHIDHLCGCCCSGDGLLDLHLMHDAKLFRILLTTLVLEFATQFESFILLKNLLSSLRLPSEIFSNKNYFFHTLWMLLRKQWVYAAKPKCEVGDGDLR